MRNEAFAVQYCGDRDNPTVSFGRIAFTLPANPMSDRGQKVCLWEEDENENRSERRCEDDAEHNRPARSEGSPRQPGDRGGLPFCIVEEMLCDDERDVFLGGRGCDSDPEEKGLQGPSDSGL